jgi:predicted PurR-regulated permease PerM
MGLFLAFAFYPLYKQFNKKLGEKTSALLVVLITLLLLVIPTVYFVKALVQESFVIYLFIKQKMAGSFLDSCQYQICDTFRGLVSSPDFVSKVDIFFQESVDTIMNTGKDFLWSLPMFFFHVLITFFIMFYSLIEHNFLFSKIKEVLKITETNFNYVQNKLKQITSGIIYGYFFVAILSGVSGGLAFFVLGLSSPVFWGVVMGILAMIPYIATATVWLPAALYLIFEGLTLNSNILIIKGVGLILYGLLVIMNLDNYLRPIIVGKKAEIHPVIILLGVIGGVYVFGLLGLFIGPLILSLTYVLIDNISRIKSD